MARRLTVLEDKLRDLLTPMPDSEDRDCFRCDDKGFKDTARPGEPEWLTACWCPRGEEWLNEQRRIPPQGRV